MNKNQHGFHDSRRAPLLQKIPLKQEMIILPKTHLVPMSGNGQWLFRQRTFLALQKLDLGQEQNKL